MSQTERNEQYYQLRNEQYVKAARETDHLAELCSLMDYHPDHGRVPEYWKPIYTEFFDKARQFGAAMAAEHGQPVELPINVHLDNVEERLADLLGWQELPMRTGELFHRWQTPGGSIIQTRPRWVSESKDAFNLAADLQLSTSYKDGYAIASFIAGGREYQARQLIADCRDSAQAMRFAATRAGIGKLEHELAQRAEPSKATGPGL